MGGGGQGGDVTVFFFFIYLFFLKFCGQMAFVKMYNFLQVMVLPKKYSLFKWDPFE